MNVTDCPESGCQCNVTVNVTEDNYVYPAMFQLWNEMGSVVVSPLQPDTWYSFTLNCIGTNETITRFIQTDIERSRGITNFTGTLIAQRISLQWVVPAENLRRTNHYKLHQWKTLIKNNIPPTQLSYNFTEEYDYGEVFIFFLTICFNNRHNETYCPDIEKGRLHFYIRAPKTTSNNKTTKSTMETTTPKNTTEISSFSRFFIICMLFFIFIEP